MKHYWPQHNTEACQRRWRREGICKARKVGGQHAAVPRQLCENHTFLLKVNPYSVCYCNTCVSSWVPDTGGGRQEELYSCTALCMYHCISHNQSSKIICLDPSIVMPQTMPPSLPLSHFQETKARWEGAYAPSSAFYWMLSELNLCKCQTMRCVNGATYSHHIFC